MSKVDVNYVVPPPDEEEEMLAKIVFGDSSDFQDNLANFTADFLLNEKEDELDELVSAADDNDNSNSDNDDVNDMENVNDDQLFFMDDGEDEDQSKVDVDGDVDMDNDEESSEEDDESDYSEDDSNAWEDSDDEKLNVSVMDNNRTKKLRNTYNDSILSGKQYVRRLRAQFEKIYPKPQWVDDEDSDSADEDGNLSDDREDDREEVLNADIHALSKILQSTYSYKDTSRSKLLPSKTLDILRLKDANMVHPAKSAIQSLSFHPSKPLLLTGGYDKTLRIYHIDGKYNHLVTSLHIKSTPIQTCSFYVSPQQVSKKKQHWNQEQRIFTGGRRRYMHSWDLSSSIMNSDSNGSMAKIEKISRLYGHESTQISFEKFRLAHFYNVKKDEVHGIILLQGNNGWVNVLNASSGIYMMGCKIEGVIVDFCIDYIPMANNKFRTVLIATNTYNEVWEFDLTNNGSVMKKWKDDSGVGITCIQVGGGSNLDQLTGTDQSNIRVVPNRWLAIGSSSGFVNVYERTNISDRDSKPTLVGTLDQLTTSISSLEFSPDGQILCISSRAVKDALRLVHLPTSTVFSNWPTSGTPLGKVTSVSFSPRGEMLAVGNEQGKVRLWRLNHY